MLRFTEEELKTINRCVDRLDVIYKYELNPMIPIAARLRPIQEAEQEMIILFGDIIKCFKAAAERTNTNSTPR